MRQSALTLVAHVKDGGLAPLRQVLKDKEAAIKDALRSLGTIHYARFVIVDQPGYKPQVAFGSNFDGPVEQHVRDLADKLGQLIDDIYSNCVDYSSADRASYLLNIRTKEAAFYQGSPGRTVGTIAQEKALRNRLVRAIAAGNWNGKSAQTIHNELRQQVLAEPEFAWAKEPIKTPGMSKLGWILLLLLTAPISIPIGLVVLLIFALWALYVQFFLELRDKAGTVLPNDIPDAVIDANIAEEDFTWQNQFSQIMVMKAGKARLYTLKVFFAVTRVLIRILFVRGKLMGIPTIHFARWVLLDNDKRLLFFSNFDGSWTQYLGDFIDKSGWGLNALFGNTTNFPRIWFFFWRGAYDEMHFLGWSRSTQIPTQIWYAADVSQSIKNINDNTLIRNDLSRDLSAAQAKQFLARL
ncbi:MAG TPA: hypothetical protein VHR66_21930 [Gemmataceae bacterium]|nr:hypothetical protein [Gemmataceae bacterium]